jgi:hypothetical protein
MDARDVKAFADRDWAAARAAKDAYWAEQYALDGPAATLAASEALRRHMRLVRPDWPTDQERREDFAHHVALKTLIDRAAGVFRSAAGR